MVVTDLLVLESFVLGSCLGRSGHNVPINLQLNKRYSLFCSFLKKCSIIKSQSLENGLSCVFQTIGHILLQKVQSQHDKAQAPEHKD